MRPVGSSRSARHRFPRCPLTGKVRFGEHRDATQALAQCRRLAKAAVEARGAGPCAARCGATAAAAAEVGTSRASSPSVSDEPASSRLGKQRRNLETSA